MGLSKDMIEKLEKLVPATTALVSIDRQPAGTAFFISQDLLLTCGHVVETGTVTIQPYGRKSRPAEVEGRADPDLALLRSAPVDGEPSPCVVLGKGLDSYDCLVAGYPHLDGAAPGCEVRKSGVHPRTDPATGDDRLLVLDPGQNITWGMSGGPVISTGSGTVIAIVRSSKDPKDALGGGAIPVSLAAESFPQVREALDGETPAMIPWRNALGQDKWQLLGRPWRIEKRLDLWVSGDRAHWKVRIDYGEGRSFPHKGPRLGTGVSKAIFYWAQRRHARAPDDVQLLSQLLARALFPNPMPAKLAELRDADSLLVCLHVEPPGNDLADIAWELAADPFSDKPDQYLAAHPQFRFTRTLAGGGRPASPPEPKPPSSIRVLTVVAQPKTWVHEDIPGPHGGHHPWPAASAMRAHLQAGIQNAGLAVTSLERPSPNRVQEALKAEPCDVLHYMGTGTREPDASAHIVFGGDEDSDEVLWPDVRTILDFASSAGVRLVVLELMLPPENADLQQLTCSAFGDVVKDGVTAVVLTNLPVYPTQCELFNEKFYRFLSQGSSIEHAVQEARRALKDDQPAADAAGFGWFTVLTGRQTSIRLATPTPRDPTLASARSPGEPPEGRNDVRYH